MFRRIIGTLFLLTTTIVLLVLAIANRHTVPFVLNPSNTEEIHCVNLHKITPELLASFNNGNFNQDEYPNQNRRSELKKLMASANINYPGSLPLFVFIFVMLALGAFLGGVASWLSQGKWRKMARQRTQEAMRWKAEAERLTKERDEQTASRKQLLAN
ncbi:MAG: LapA family protein [Pseudomonadota bacterium]